MSEEIELAAKSTGAVVGAVLDASGVTAPMQEVTGWLASWLHPRLVASAAKQMMAAVEKLEQAGVRPGAVRDEQMRALLEEGTREEDEGLKEKWANLLAHGLTGDLDCVPRAFGEVLRQLEPIEAQTLDAIASNNVTVLGTESGTRISHGDMANLPLPALVNLERLGLVELARSYGPPNLVQTPGGTESLKSMRLTTFGLTFVQACRAPDPLD